MFALACAAATAMPAGHLPPLLAAALVAAGGGFSWLVHMSGALFDVRGPERKAAFALQNAWDVLVNQQPAWGRGSTTVGRLRTLVRGLHLAFADAMGAAGRGASPDPGLAAGVHRLLAAVDGPDGVEATDSDAVPPGHPRAREALLQALRPGSEMRRILLRVAIAALLAGGLASLLDLERAYWAVAAAVLLLFQGFDWVRMLAHSTERLLGTWVGLLLGGAIIAWHPQGLALVLVVMALQFCVEMLVMRNYAIAVVFITGAALTLASGGQPVDDVGRYVLARGVDTLLGVAVALLVYRALPPRPATATLPERLRGTIDAVAALVPVLASGRVTAPEARDRFRRPPRLPGPLRLLGPGRPRRAQRAGVGARDVRRRRDRTPAGGARRPLGRRRQRRHPARSRDPAARARARSAGTARVPHPRAAGARAHRGAVEWCAGGRTPLRTRTPCTPRSTTTPAAARRATRSR